MTIRFWDLAEWKNKDRWQKCKWVCYDVLSSKWKYIHCWNSEPIWWKCCWCRCDSHHRRKVIWLACRWENVTMGRGFQQLWWRQRLYPRLLWYYVRKSRGLQPRACCCKRYIFYSDIYQLFNVYRIQWTISTNLIKTLIPQFCVRTWIMALKIVLVIPAFGMKKIIDIAVITTTMILMQQIYAVLVNQMVSAILLFS